MARPQKSAGRYVRQDRRGLYLLGTTRDRLNRFKLRLANEVQRPVSQDDAVNTLLDLVEANDEPAVPA
jgi:hypothetical protein